MAKRIFYCKRCGHHMRYGAPRCGSCMFATPFYNRAWLLIITGLIVLALIVLL